MSLFEMKNIKKSFDGKEVLKDISFSVEKGQVLAIIGPSGSGKSTILRIATGLETKDAGDILFDGTFGLVFQDFNLFPHHSVMKNITNAPVKVQKRDKKEVNNVAKDLLKKMGLEDKENNYPSQLSGGEKQRVSIARALAKNPKILLCDEPTGALDSRTSAEVIDSLIDLNSQGNTIILITHDNFIAARAKRVIRIHDGKITYDGIPANDSIIRQTVISQKEGEV